MLTTSKIEGEAYLTTKVSQLTKLGSMAFIFLSAVYTFLGRVDTLESTDVSLLQQIVVRDSLIRKDMRKEFESFRIAMETGTFEMVTARETDVRELTTALETVNATLVAEIEANRRFLQLELDSQARSMISMNATTHAELKPLIDNIQNTMVVEIDALKTRISLAEGLIQDPAKRGLFGIGRKQ